MAFADEKTVITMAGVVIWNGFTKPDPVESEPGKFNHNLRIAFLPGQPEQAELEKLVDMALQKSAEFKGVMPHGGNHPIGTIDPNKFPELPGHLAFTAGTRQGPVPVYDANGAELQPMQYGPMFYNGTVVKLLVNAYPYSNKQKGVNFGLCGICIVDAKAPKLSIGASMSSAEVGAAFFGGGAKTSTPAATQQQTVNANATSYAGYANTGNDAPPPVIEDDAPPPIVEWPPAGWKPNPSNPAWWYNTTTKEQIKEAVLRERVGA